MFFKHRKLIIRGKDSGQSFCNLVTDFITMVCFRAGNFILQIRFGAGLCLNYTTCKKLRSRFLFRLTQMPP
jgi:hypothetical protein